MIPLSEQRRQALEFFENFMWYINFYKERNEQVSRPMLNEFYDPKTRLWKQ